MSLDPSARREVQRQLNEIIAQKGKDAVRTILDEYMTIVPGLEDWEVKEIVSLGQAYQLENGHE
jgi:hypothetical protein